jgi:hypothetical protein
VLLSVCPSLHRRRYALQSDINIADRLPESMKNGAHTESIGISPELILNADAILMQAEMQSASYQS